MIIRVRKSKVMTNAITGVREDGISVTVPLRDFSEPSYRDGLQKMKEYFELQPKR
jgi:hypothetical protein